MQKQTQCKANQSKSKRLKSSSDSTQRNSVPTQISANITFKGETWLAIIHKISRIHKLHNIVISNILATHIVKRQNNSSSPNSITNELDLGWHNSKPTIRMRRRRRSAGEVRESNYQYSLTSPLPSFPRKSGPAEVTGLSLKGDRSWRVDIQTR